MTEECCICYLLPGGEKSVTNMEWKSIKSIKDEYLALMVEAIRDQVEKAERYNDKWLIIEGETNYWGQ